MRTIKDANNENRGVPSPSFIKNMGRLKDLPPSERVAIARKGGLVVSERKKRSSQLNPITTGRATSVIDIANCDDCPISSVCHLYKPNSACAIEIQIRRNLIRQFKAFAGTNPEDLLLEIMKAYNILRLGKFERFA